MEVITVSQLKDRIKEKGLTLIDIREEYEHEEFNIGGKCLPMGDVQKWSAEIISSPDMEYIIYCRSGNRSAMVASYLINAGASNVKSLKGGVKAWMESK